MNIFQDYTYDLIYYVSYQEQTEHKTDKAVDCFIGILRSEISVTYVSNSVDSPIKRVEILYLPV
jgi:hypothetical protein